VAPSDPPAWLPEAQRPPAVIPADASRPAPLLFDAAHQPIATPAAWSARREAHATAWTAFLGTIPRPAAPPTLTTLEEDRREGVIRRLVRYEAEPGVPVEAYVLQPPEPGPPRPGLVVLHSTVDHTIRQPAGLDGPSDKHLGLQFARLGYVAICPRCFLWQHGEPGRLESAVAWFQHRHPGVRGMAKMLFDAVRATDALAALPEVDPSRIGAIGHSLGAKEALYLAAFDPRIRAAVFSEGGLALADSNWEAPWYLGDAIRRPGFALDHAQLLSLVAPRAFLVIGGDSADGDRTWPHIEAALPVWSLTGAPSAVGLLNHRQGHAYPPFARQRAEEWLAWFLAV
jgi:dienelactone hydrolase